MGTNPLYSAFRPSSAYIFLPVAIKPRLLYPEIVVDLPAAFIILVLTTSAGVDVIADATPAILLAPKCARVLSRPKIGAKISVLIWSYTPSSVALTMKVLIILGLIPAKKPLGPSVLHIARATFMNPLLWVDVCICVLMTSVQLKHAIDIYQHINDRSMKADHTYHAGNTASSKSFDKIWCLVIAMI